MWLVLCKLLCDVWCMAVGCLVNTSQPGGAHESGLLGLWPSDRLLMTGSWLLCGPQTSDDVLLFSWMSKECLSVVSLVWCIGGTCLSGDCYMGGTCMVCAWSCLTEVWWKWSTWSQIHVHVSGLWCTLMQKINIRRRIPANSFWSNNSSPCAAILWSVRARKHIEKKARIKNIFLKWLSH